jgi:hypothetical protein
MSIIASVWNYFTASNSYTTPSVRPASSSSIHTLIDRREFQQAAHELFTKPREEFVKTWMYLVYSASRTDTHCETVISNAQDIARDKDRTTRTTSFFPFLQLLEDEFKKASKGSYTPEEALGKVDSRSIESLEREYQFFASLPWNTNYVGVPNSYTVPAGSSSIHTLIDQREFQQAAKELFTLPPIDFVEMWMYLMDPDNAHYATVISNAQDIAKAKGMPFSNFLYLFKEKAEDLWKRSYGFEDAWSKVDPREIEELNRDYKFLESLPWKG